MLIRNPDKTRLSVGDAVPGYLADKVIPGQNIAFIVRNDPSYGEQVLISSPSGPNSAGQVFEIKRSCRLEDTTALAIIDASEGLVEITLPHPSECLNWVGIVAKDTSGGIVLKLPPDTFMIDQTGFQLNFAGDSITLASNRRDTWFIMSRYHANWYY